MAGRLSLLKTRAREQTLESVERVKRPRKLERFDDVPRDAQWLSLAFLPFVIIASLAIIVAFNQLLVDVFGVPAEDSQFEIAGFFVTGLTLGMFVFLAWSWFQFVRTGGFGFFARG